MAKKKRTRHAKRGHAVKVNPQAPKSLARQTTRRLIASGGGVLAILIALITFAISVSGVTSSELIVAPLATAFIVAVGGILASERFAAATWKHTIIATLVAAVVCGIPLALFGDYLINRKAMKEQQSDSERVSLQERLDHAEFQAEASKPLRAVIVNFRFNRPYSVQEMGVYRAMIEISDCEQSPTKPALMIGGQYYYIQLRTDRDAISFGTEWTTWSRNPTKEQPEPTRLLRAFASPAIDLSAQLVELGIRPFSTTDDLNGACLHVYISESLVGKVEEITLRTNDHDLTSAKVDKFLYVDENPTTWILPPGRGMGTTPRWKRIYLKPSGSLLLELQSMRSWVHENYGTEPEQVPTPWQLDFSMLKPKKVIYPE